MLSGAGRRGGGQRPPESLGCMSDALHPRGAHWSTHSTRAVPCAGSPSLAVRQFDLWGSETGLLLDISCLWETKQWQVNVGVPVAILYFPRQIRKAAVMPMQTLTVKQTCSVRQRWKELWLYLIPWFCPEVQSLSAYLLFLLAQIRFWHSSSKGVLISNGAHAT